MNKLELIEKLSAAQNITRQQATEVVQIFFDEICAALERGDRIEIRGLCSLHVKEYGAYTGRNPKTGEHVTVAPKKLPFFKCGQGLRERMNAPK